MLGLGILWAVLLSPLAILYGTLTVLILAHIVRGFPFGTQIMGSSMIQISRELEEAARIHKASWPSTFRRIWLPLVKNGFVAGWVIQFTVSFSDLATVAFLLRRQVGRPADALPEPVVQRAPRRGGGRGPDDDGGRSGGGRCSFWRNWSELALPPHDHNAKVAAPAGTVRNVGAGHTGTSLRRGIRHSEAGF